jgi:hypothetical protein
VERSEIRKAKTVLLSKSRGKKKCGWTLGATSVYMWLLSSGTDVEPKMKATQKLAN